MIRRRTMLAAGGLALAAPSIARADAARTLKMVPFANVSVLDPQSAAYFARNHAYMVYDMLYGWNDKMESEPQMAAGHVTEDGGKSVTITLRDHLRFHDKEPVRAADAVASLRRWMKRNPYGQYLETITDELTALDDKKFRFRLKKPFPLMITGFGSIDWPCVVMPERIAKTDISVLITDPIGSGPFRFNKDAYDSGNLIVYDKNADYVPVSGGTARLTAGPKIVHFDRVELHVIPDPSTASAALKRGEVDWFEKVPADLIEDLAKDKAIHVEPIGAHDVHAVFRINHLQPPFNNPDVRRALLPALDQSDFMRGVMGSVPNSWHGDVGVYPPESHVVSKEGMAPLLGKRDLEGAKAKLAALGFAGHKLRLVAPADVPEIAQFTHVGADWFARLGFDVDLVELDSGAAAQKRNSKAPLDAGGWSATPNTPAAFGFMDPSVNQFIRGSGEAGLWGWPKSTKLEELRIAWFEAGDEAARRKIAGEMQAEALDVVTILPLGTFKSFTAHRTYLTGRVPGLPFYWGIKRV